MALVKKGDIYYHVFYVDKKQKWVCLRTNYKEEALIRLGEILRQQHRPSFGVARDPQDIRWEELVAKFMDQKRANGDSPRTIERNVAYFKSVARVLGLSMTSEWSAELLEQFKLQRLEEGGAAGTVNKELEAIRGALKKGRLWGYIAPPAEALEQVRKVKDPRRPAFYFHDAGVERMLAAAKPFWRVAIMLGLRAGLRRSEALNLLWADVDFERRELHVVDRPGAHTKNRRSRTIPLDAELAECLTAWRTELGSGLCVLPWENTSYGGKSNFTRAFRRFLIRLGFPGAARYHSLRHTFATNLARANVNQLKIAYLMGHSSVTTTTVYTHMEMKDMRDAIEQLPRTGKASNTLLIKPPMSGNIRQHAATRTNRTGEENHEQV